VILPGEKPEKKFKCQNQAIQPFSQGLSSTQRRKIHEEKKESLDPIPPKLNHYYTKEVFLIACLCWYSSKNMFNKEIELSSTFCYIVKDFAPIAMTRITLKLESEWYGSGCKCVNSDCLALCTYLFIVFYHSGKKAETGEKSFCPMKKAELSKSSSYSKITKILFIQEIISWNFFIIYFWRKIHTTLSTCVQIRCRVSICTL